MKRSAAMMLAVSLAWAGAVQAAPREEDEIKSAKGRFEAGLKYIEKARKAVAEGQRHYGGMDHFGAVRELEKALAHAKLVKSAKGKAEVKSVLDQAPKLRQEALAETFDFVETRVKGFLESKKTYEAAQSLQDLGKVAEKDPRYQKLVAKSGCGPDKQSPWMIDCDR